jgi:tight adherence protein C
MPITTNLIAILVLCSLALLAVSVLDLSPRRRRAVLRRLAELEHYDPLGPPTARGVWWQEWRREAVTMLGSLGGRRDRPEAQMRDRLIQAGYRHPQMTSIYRGACIAAMVAGGLAGIGIVMLAGTGPTSMLVMASYGALLGFLFPRWYLSRAISRRKSELQRALPDALDLLVVCVEAGLGLSQSLRRVADEIGAVSPALRQELTTVNLEIRAGAPRLEALKNLGERTDMDDLRALAAMLAQTERFGTPVADALRANSESLRIKRRQRAEEAAAKTTIKLLFPLVLFIFPPLYVVILGPAILQMINTLNAGGM